MPIRSFDVNHYDAQVEPDIAHKTITGRVLLRLISRADNLAAFEVDCGDLIIDVVKEGREPQVFVRRNRRLSVTLSRPAKAKETREIEIEYHGAPRRGIRFFPEREQVYTVTTADFQTAMEQASGKNLAEFFSKWVYLTQRSFSGSATSGAHTTARKLRRWKEPRSFLPPGVLKPAKFGSTG